MRQNPHEATRDSLGCVIIVGIIIIARVSSQDAAGNIRGRGCNAVAWNPRAGAKPLVGTTSSRPPRSLADTIHKPTLLKWAPRRRLSPVGRGIMSNMEPSTSSGTWGQAACPAELWITFSGRPRGSLRTHGEDSARLNSHRDTVVHSGSVKFRDISGQSINSVLNEKKSATPASVSAPNLCKRASCQ